MRAVRLFFSVGTLHPKVSLLARWGTYGQVAGKDAVCDILG